MSLPYPLVEVSAVVITNTAGQVLLDFNDHWGSFTLPMSKQHELPPMTENAPTTMESPQAAAIRAAVEVIGRPLAPSSLTQVNAELPAWNQSGRDGQWKRYTYTVFAMKVSVEPKPLAGHTAIWLDRKEMESLEPISPTVRKILNALPV